MLTVVLIVCPLIVIAVLGYEIWKYANSRTVARVTPEDLKIRIEKGEPLVLADLRSWQQVMQSGDKLPGARLTSANELLRDLGTGVINGTLILYCT
jgi:hypothetical protein